MLNERLYLLANRGTGFSYKGFLENAQFKAFPDTDPVARKVRELLRINEHDYYLKAYLQCMNAFPDVRRLFAGPEVLDLSQPFADEFGRLKGLQASRLHCIWNDAYQKTFPINFRYVFRRDSNTRISIHLEDLSAVETCEVRQLTPIDADTLQFQILHKDVPEGVVLEDRFGVQGPFEVGDQFRVVYHPKMFPYRAASAHLRKHQELIMQLLEPNLWAERFLTSNDSVERVALVAAALALRPLYA